MPSQGGLAEQHDGINEEAWLRLCEAVIAAHRFDGLGHAQALLRWRREVALPIQQRAGAYLLYLLWRHIKTLLGRKPSPEDLRELAISIYPRFRDQLRGSEIQLDAVLRRAFGYTLPAAQVTPGEFMVFGSVALGLLLAEPQRELDLMRPGMASWWHKNKDRFREEGLLDDPSP
jgi:hypothetical protein